MSGGRRKPAPGARWPGAAHAPVPWRTSQTDLRRTWEAVCKAAGLTDLRFHDLRHAFASFLASSGQNLPLIGQLLGHSQAATTQRYAHLLMDPQRPPPNGSVRSSMRRMRQRQKSRGEVSD